MTESNSGLLKCPVCNKEYPVGTAKCTDDGAELNKDATESDSLIGKLFAEKYEILSLLGEGGMSKVYKARHKFMKRIVAVKLLHESATKDPTAKARFQQEAEAASALNHQNVVTVHDFGFTPSGQAFFVMDCLEGKTLEELLEVSKNTMPLPEAVDIFAQACDGLDHAHRKGIVHRDIKPSNLVIIKQEDGSDLVKIVDFGIAKVLAPSAEGAKQQQLTQAGEIFGTPAYMSPEQCNGKPLDGRSDIYSFGCLMYETLSGLPPHLGETFINTIVKHINERPKSFAESAPHLKVPEHIEAVVMKCLEKEPGDRYTSAVELKQALFDAAFVSGVKGLRFGAVPEPKTPTGSGDANAAKSQIASLSEQKVTRRWRMGFTLTVAALVSIIGAVSAWMFLYPGPDGDRGTVFYKLNWQYRLSRADDLTHLQKYSEAVKELEQARELTKQFNDGQGRLEITLNKLGDAYGQAHDYANQEIVNKQLVNLATRKVYIEFDALMAMLKQWESTPTSSTAGEQRAMQAAAFAERITRCADKLSIRSREREELLLTKAIKIFDSMETKDWKSEVRFRITLSECYRMQQRFKEQRNLLTEAVKLCPEKPNTQEGWRSKVQANLLLGELNRNVAMDDAQLDHARETFETVLGWIKQNLPKERELLRQTLNSMAIVDRLYHKKEYDEKADEIEKQAKALEADTPGDNAAD